MLIGHFCVSSFIDVSKYQGHILLGCLYFYYGAVEFLFNIHFCFMSFSVLGLSCGTQIINLCCNVQDL